MRWRRGVVARFCSTLASVNPCLTGIKHLNRLDSVLARQEWSDSDADEGLMLDPFGAVVGGTASNLFLWDGRRLFTPSLDHSGIAGTIRGLTLEHAARMGVDCLVTRIDPSDLERARGLFLTNAIIGVWPIRRLAGRGFDLAELPWDLLSRVFMASRTPR